MYYDAQQPLHSTLSSPTLRPSSRPSFPNKDQGYTFRSPQFSSNAHHQHDNGRTENTAPTSPLTHPVHAMPFTLSMGQPKSS